jgi:hypothetical protein
VLRDVLPTRYSPLQPDGNGLQSVYLTEIPTLMFEILLGLIGPEAQNMVQVAGGIEVSQQQTTSVVSHK